jgi:rubredoxin
LDVHRQQRNPVVRVIRTRPRPILYNSAIRKHAWIQAAEGKQVSEKEFKSWMCVVCGWIYHEEEGSPDDGIPPGTKWEDVPESWVCPDCGAGKEDFEMVEL